MEVESLQKFIFQKISAQAAVTVSNRVYADMAAQGLNNERLPAIVYSFETVLQDSGSTTARVGGYRSPGAFVFLVKAVTAGWGATQAAAITNAIDAALAGARGVVDEYKVLDTRRMSCVNYLEMTDGLPFRHSGASYRFDLIPTFGGS